MSYNIPEVKVRLRLTSMYSIELNSWTGSTIRGAISNKLMLKYCFNKRHNCGDCISRNTCPISILFNASSAEDKKLNTNPIVINAFYKDTSETHNSIDFELSLFGNGIMAFQTIMLELKDGIQPGKSMALFKLTEAKYSSGKDVFVKGIIREIDVNDIVPLKIESNILKVTFQSPLVIKESFRDMTFKSFVRACLIRSKAVSNTVGIELDYAYRELVEKANRVKTLENSIDNYSLIRYSKTKNTRTSITGRIGQVQYEGDFTEFIPYISIAQEFNIGQWCTMGLGRFTVEDGGNDSEI